MAIAPAVPLALHVAARCAACEAPRQDTERALVLPPLLFGGLDDRFAVSDERARVASEATAADEIEPALAVLGEHGGMVAPEDSTTKASLLPFGSKLALIVRGRERFSDLSFPERTPSSM